MGAAPASATTVEFPYVAPSVATPTPFATWTAPSGVTQATFDLYGARGGAGRADRDLDGLGKGARVTTTMAVVPGTTYRIYIGGRGRSGAGGYNGGGNSARYGGGGATDVRDGPGYGLADRLLVAGGGGGEGASIGPNQDNGSGGNSDTNGVDALVTDGPPAGGGKSGSNGGAGGVGSADSFDTCSAGGSGTAGVGGDGAPAASFCMSGGGGGGGLVGGGAGGSDFFSAGGGGGSSKAGDGTVVNGARRGDGHATVSFTKPADDSATVDEDPAAPVAIDVSANDTDFMPADRLVDSVTQPANGTVVKVGASGLTYQPDKDYCNTQPGGQPDTFTYNLSGSPNTATVSVTVNCIDEPSPASTPANNPPAEGTQSPSSTAPGSLPDVVAPTITGAKFSASSFAVDSNARASAKAKRGTKLSLRLSESATVVFVTEQRVKGRWRKVRIFGRRLPAGTSVIGYSGKIKPRGRTRALKPGRYRLRVRASDRGGNRGAVTVLGFRITG